LYLGRLKAGNILLLGLFVLGHFVLGHFVLVCFVGVPSLQRIINQGFENYYLSSGLESVGEKMLNDATLVIFCNFTKEEPFLLPAFPLFSPQ
jgi:hypothetical protein